MTNVNMSKPQSLEFDEAWRIMIQSFAILRDDLQMGDINQAIRPARRRPQNNSDGEAGPKRSQEYDASEYLDVAKQSFHSISHY